MGDKLSPSDGDTDCDGAVVPTNGGVLLATSTGDTVGVPDNNTAGDSVGA